MPRRYRGVKKKKSFLSLLTPFLLWSLLVFVILLLTVSNIRIHQRRTGLKAQIKDKEAEMDLIKEKFQELEGFEFSEYEDDFFIEKVAREQFLLKKEGEEAIFISFPEVTEDEESDEQEVVWWNPLTWKPR